MLQLKHGFRHPELRHRETLGALKALAEKKILPKDEYKLLSDGYLFLRTLDHRLRLERDQSIDAFEREPERLGRIAQALGYGGKRAPSGKAGQKLLCNYEEKREKIRSCYERYFLPTERR
jgi:glutamate-ammonia-ligase adenylyltransferase